MDHPQNADLLRPFDLEAAKAGAPVQILGRAPKPKTEKVRLLAWLGFNGRVHFVKEGSPAHNDATRAEGWRRVPGEDKEVEVEL